MAISDLEALEKAGRFHQGQLDAFALVIVALLQSLPDRQLRRFQERLFPKLELWEAQTLTESGRFSEDELEGFVAFREFFEKLLGYEDGVVVMAGLDPKPQGPDPGDSCT
jgi:hypothetical protein